MAIEREGPAECDSYTHVQKLAYNRGIAQAVVAPRAGATKGSGVAKTSSRSGACATKAVLRCNLGKAGNRQAATQAGRSALFSAA